MCPRSCIRLRSDTSLRASLFLFLFCVVTVAHGVWFPLYPCFSRVLRVLSADPTTKAELSKLEFLQALIIELGLYTGLAALPSSMRAAKALLKGQVFLNVRDYLAVRSQGVDALRAVMHPSRSALMREIRSGKKETAKTVKETGLSVLLVTCYR